MPWATTPSAPIRYITYSVHHHPAQRYQLRLFYDNPSSCWLDLGTRSTTTTPPIAAGRRKRDIDYYLFTGKQVLDVTKAFVRLTGKNAV